MFSSKRGRNTKLVLVKLVFWVAEKEATQIPFRYICKNGTRSMPSEKNCVGDNADVSRRTKVTPGAESLASCLNGMMVRWHVLQ
mmetsp:Transcript_8927/g.21818  ORF Transcript_8927/g.21818 Transcript_8927/m.21818 type:complete len:84 (-) Transcript_8927:71-322(-)